MLLQEKVLYTFVFLAKVGACGGNYTAESGVIYSPDFPDKYAPGRVCYWTIQVKKKIVSYFHTILLKGLWQFSFRIVVHSVHYFSRSRRHRSCFLTLPSSTSWTRRIWSSCWMVTPTRWWRGSMGGTHHGKSLTSAQTLLFCISTQTGRTRLKVSPWSIKVHFTVLC